MLRLRFETRTTTNEIKPYSVFCLYFTPNGDYCGQHFVSAFSDFQAALLKTEKFNTWYENSSMR